MYPRPNGKTEASVQLAKNTRRKTMGSDGDVQLALVELRNTPKQDAGVSPTQILFGRQTQSLLPIGQVPETSEAVKAKKEKRKNVKKHRDKTARRLNELEAFLQTCHFLLFSRFYKLAVSSNFPRFYKLVVFLTLDCATYMSRLI